MGSGLEGESLRFRKDYRSTRRAWKRHKTRLAIHGREVWACRVFVSRRYIKVPFSPKSRSHVSLGRENNRTGRLCVSLVHSESEGAIPLTG
jgi:hypothetical protein